MKKLVNVQEVEGAGLVSLLGENVQLICGNYIYAGKLTGVNDICVELENAGIVYETGDWNSKTWKNFQALQSPYFVMIRNIESFGKSGK